MDYCYACGRHLNGAYSCPGCGTPADQLKLPQVGETAQLPPIVGDEHIGEAGEAEGVADPDAPGAPPYPDTGRAAARGRQRGRSRGRQQRVAVYGVGLVAVVGALAMLSMAALSDSGSGGTSPSAPVVTDTTSPPAGTVSPAATGSAEPQRSSPSGTPHRTQSPTATRTTGSATPTAPATTGPPPATTSPPPSRTAAPPHPSTKPPHSAPPSPTPTCKKVLWWCQ